MTALHLGAPGVIGRLRRGRARGALDHSWRIASASVTGAVTSPSPSLLRWSQRRPPGLGLLSASKGKGEQAGLGSFRPDLRQYERALAIFPTKTLYVKHTL